MFDERMDILISFSCPHTTQNMAFLKLLRNLQRLNIFPLTTHVHAWIASCCELFELVNHNLTTHVHAWIASAQRVRLSHSRYPDNPRTRVDCVSKTTQKQSIKLYKWGLRYFVPSLRRLKREAMQHWKRFPNHLLLGSNQYEDRSLVK